jgi:two-component system C4-dicarboxylate transport response regulator DctD
VCDSAVAGERAVAQASPAEFLAAIIAWELPGPPFAFELLAYCRRVRPELPVMIVAGVLDASLAVRAVALGARGFLERPLDSESLRAAIRRFRTEQDPAAPLVAELRKKVLGESPVLLNCLQQVAKVIPHDDTRVLLLGESGTGKELLAQAVHRLSRRCQAPWVAVNMGAIPKAMKKGPLPAPPSVTSAASRKREKACCFSTKLEIWIHPFRSNCCA